MSKINIDKAKIRSKSVLSQKFKFKNWNPHFDQFYNINQSKNGSID